MKDKLTFGFCGGYGVGKSYLATALKQELETEYGFKAKVFSFGNGVREYCIINKILTRSEAYEKPTSERVRFILRTQSYLSKRENPNIWVEAIQKVMEMSVYDVAIFDDIRFSNEYGFLLPQGLILTYLGASQNRYELPFLEEMSDIHLEERQDLEDFISLFEEVIC